MLSRKQLFEAPGPTGGPLFEGCSDLARVIAAQPGYSANKERSLKSFLSQILSGDRACSPRLRTAILDAVRSRVADQDPDADTEGWATRVARALDLDNTTRDTLHPMNSEALFFELENLAEEASEHFIITARPLEEAVSPRAAILRGVLLKRLGLDDLQQEPQTSYVFCLPTQEACREWWASLFQRNAHSASGRDAAAHARRFSTKLCALDEGNHIRVTEIDRGMCGVPVIVYDPRSSTPSGFVFFLHDPDAVSVAKMSRQDLEHWLRNVYWPLQPSLEEHRVRATNALGGLV